MLTGLRILATLASVFAVGGTAFACPTSADMAKTGVWVTLDDGGTVHYRRGSGNVIIETAVYPGEDEVETRSAWGVYFLQDATLKRGDIVPGTVNRYEYQDVTSLPDPDSKGNWTGDITVYEVGEDEPSNDRMLMTRGVPVNVSIGECAYSSRVIVATMTFQDGRTWTTQYNYISDLGIALFSAAGESPFNLESFYRSTAISATQP